MEVKSSWDHIEEDDDEDETQTQTSAISSASGVLHSVTPQIAPRDRSRSPRPTLPPTAGPSGPRAETQKLVLRPGLAWWLKPLVRAIMKVRCRSAILEKVPRFPMLHFSVCSGMLTELFAAQASYLLHTCLRERNFFNVVGLLAGLCRL